MHNKAVIISHALIGTAVAASFYFTKKLERDIARDTAKMAQDREELMNRIANLGK